MKLLLAILYRDLLFQSRKKFLRLKRIVFIAIISFILLYIPYTNRGYDNSSVGLQIFLMFTWIVFLVVLILTPLTASTLISEEREHKTLPLLMLTDLSPFHIIIGKFFSQVSMIILVCLSTLPLFMVCIGLGGISGEQIIAVFCIILSFLLLGSSIGIFCSTLVSTKNAQGLSLALILAYIGIIPLVHAITPIYLSKNLSVNLFQILSPIYSLVNALQGRMLSNCFWNMAFQIAISLPFLFLSMLLLPGINASSENTPLNVKVKRYIHKKFMAAKKREYISGNPILWYEHCKIGGGTKISLIKASAVSLIIAAFVIFFHSFTKSYLSIDKVVGIILLYILMTSFAAAGITIFNRCLRTFAPDKEQKTLELILSTGLTNNEIVWGKLYGIFKSTIGYWIAVVITGAILLAVAPSYDIPHESQFLLFIFYPLSYLLAISNFAIYVSLKSSTLRKASSHAVLVIIIWHIVNNWVYYTFFPPFFYSVEGGFAFYILLYLIFAVVFYNFTLSDLRTSGINK